jgi:D-inositol-3-phosphate glycosyltransferase
MNVYVRELASALAEAGVSSRVYVRRWRDDLPPTVDVEPGFQVVHVPAGPPDLAKEDLEPSVEPFADWVADDLARHRPDVVHANYWLSGIAGRLLKQRLDLPLVTTFHTLARVKAEVGDPEPERRAKAEADVMSCADVVLANCSTEAEQLSSTTWPIPAGSRWCPPVSTTPSSPLGARPVPVGRWGSTTGRCCCSSAGSSR